MQDESLPTPDQHPTAQIAPDAPEHEDAGNGKLEVVTGCMVHLWLC